MYHYVQLFLQSLGGSIMGANSTSDINPILMASGATINVVTHGTLIILNNMYFQQCYWMMCSLYYHNVKIPLLFVYDEIEIYSRECKPIHQVGWLILQWQANTTNT